MQIFTFFALFSGLFTAFSPLSAQAQMKCELGRCFTKVFTTEAEQKKIIESNKAVLVVDANTGSDYQANYIYKFVPNVTTDLAIAVFAKFEEHSKTLNPPITKSVLRSVGKGQAVVEYELDTSKVLSGLGSMAPVSKYVVVERITNDEGKGLIQWQIDKLGTDALYPAKKGGLFSKLKDAVSIENKGKAEWIHGYFMVESVPGGVVVTYANFIIPESKMMAGTVNKQAADAQMVVAEKTIDAIVAVSKQTPEIQHNYVRILCQRFLE